MDEQVHGIDEYLDREMRKHSQAMAKAMYENGNRK